MYDVTYYRASPKMFNLFYCRVERLEPSGTTAPTGSGLWILRANLSPRSLSVPLEYPRRQSGDP